MNDTFATYWLNKQESKQREVAELAASVNRPELLVEYLEQVEEVKVVVTRVDNHLVTVWDGHDFTVFDIGD